LQDESKKPLEDNTSSNKKIANKEINDEFGGPKGLEPTRYGDWEINGRVSDF